MSVSSREEERLLRQAFGRLIEIRQQRGAARSLALANSFLTMLARNPNQEAPSFVISLKAIPIQEDRAGSTPTGGIHRED